MTVKVSPRRWASPLLLLVLGLFAQPAERASAQVNPLWDHYKVYVTPPANGPYTGAAVLLEDQFGTYSHFLQQLELFMNPTEKTVPGQGTFGITDPDLHYSWWRITTQPFLATVTATNQFGDHTLTVFDGVYVVSPARKNQPGGPPVGNHYKCYFCDGPPVNRQVLLTDQFGSWSTVAMAPRFFCNPTIKTVQLGGSFPIIDPNQHYVCYEFVPEDPTPYTATMTDQFIVDHPMDLHPSQMLCVPTYKSGITAGVRDTWGKLKLLYR
jgi:hypothetical protein